MDKKSKSGAPVIAAIGIIIISLGLFFAYRSYSYTQGAVETGGTVIAYIDVIDECFPVVSFKTFKGETVEFINNNRELDRSSASWQQAKRIPFGDRADVCFLQTLVTSKGGNVSVLYHENNPQKAVINDFFSRFILSTFLLLIGLLTLVAGFQSKKRVDV